MMHTRHKHTTSTRRNTHTSHTRTPTAPHHTIQTENTKSITSTTQTHNILQHSMTKKILFLTTAAAQQTFPQTHTVTTTNMRHIYTYIVSRHLATRGNKKILRTPPPHISSSCPTQKKQISLPQIILTQSRRQITSITTMPPLQHPHTRHTPSLQLHPHKQHMVTPGFMDRPCWSDGAAGQMYGEAGWWTKSGMIGLPPSHKQGSREWVDKNITTSFNTRFILCEDIDHAHTGHAKSTVVVVVVCHDQVRCQIIQSP